MPSQTVSIIGSHTRNEFLPLFKNLEILLQQNNRKYSIHSRLHTVSTDTELLILFQSYAGEFSVSVLHDIKKTVPLAPVILLAGAAAEGEARTGNPLAGAFRVYAHQWNREYDLEFLRLLRNEMSVFALPPTTENDEIELQHIKNIRNPPFMPTGDGKIEKMDYCVLSRSGPFGNDAQMNRMLANSFQKRGYSVLSEPVPPNISFRGTLLADADDSPFSEIYKGIQRLRRQFADADIKVYINSPRINEINDLKAAGADEILAKPAFW